MKVPKHLVQELVALMKKEFAVDITFAEAEELSESLYVIFSVLTGCNRGEF